MLAAMDLFDADAPRPSLAVLAPLACALAALALSACTCSPGRVTYRDPEGRVIRPDGSRPDAGRMDSGDRDTGPPPRPDAGSDTSVPAAEICSNGTDDDGDGATDCADTECNGEICDAAGNLCTPAGCNCGTEASEVNCGDDIDDDCDGMVDCADPECEGVVCGMGAVVCGAGACPCASGFEEDLCGDGTDDDCDALIDCADPDCLNRLCGVEGHICRSSGMCECVFTGVERCEGTDDDCDSVVDNSCPRSISSCCPTTSSFGGTSEAAWADACPTGAALIGVSGRAGARVDQLQPICAIIRFTVDMRLDPEYSYSATRGSPILGATHGAAGASDFDDRCPGNEFVIGITGSADTALDGIQLHCGTLDILRVTPASWGLIVTPTGSTPSRGGSSSSFDGGCGPNAVVTGLAGRAGSFVTQLSVTCRTLSLEVI